MNFYKSFQLAISNIWARKIRSLLTMLGIIIGVVAVIVIVGLGNGLENYMVDSFKSMGTDQLTVNIFGRGSTRTISVDEMYDLVDDHPEYLNAVSPQVPLGGNVKIGTETPSYTSVTGVGEEYLVMNKLNLDYGRFISYADTDRRNKVAVVGAYINNEWFAGNALGQTLRINGQLYDIIGVLTAETDEIEEVDLHIQTLVESHEDMKPGEILEVQMSRFTTALEGAIRAKSRKLVFIHGVGNGRLKHKIRKTIEREYPRLQYQDASFKEYGYGATMVIIK